MILRKENIHIFGVTALLAIFVCSCDKLPDTVEVSDIPNYYFNNNYLDDRVKAINDAITDCSDGCESFFWITDIHWEPDLNTRKSPALIKYISSQTGIEKIINGGDTGNSQVICENAIAQLRRAIGSDKVYTVTGNHEINDASRYESPFMRVADELRGHNSDIIYGDGDKSFFYFDSQSSKTRYVGLSSYRLFLDNDYESGYTEEQLSWFRDEALNVQSDWTIIIFTHSLYQVGNPSNELVTGPSSAKAFIDAIDNYRGNGNIACVLIGHSHRDRIHIGKSGVPYIISASDRHASHKGDINVNRIPGTISEQHFEAVVIDKGKRQIKLFSIGANSRNGLEDDPGEEVDVRIVNY